jgi:hypothetical protein
MMGRQLLDQFREEFRRELRPLQVEKLHLIDCFDYSPVVRRVGKEKGVRDEVYLAQGVENLKRYYAVALLDPLNQHAVSASVDPFWHNHILFTHEYVEFCDSVFGQYIHHKPLDADDLPEVQRVRELYAYTREVYRMMFSSVDQTWWPDSADNPEVVVCTHQAVSSAKLVRVARFAKRHTLHAELKAV